MDYDRDIVRGDMGFTYDPQVMENVSIVDIRDPQDDYFAQVRYFQDSEQYVVEIDGGYSVREDLEETGLFEGIDIQRTNIAPLDSMFEEAPDELTEWRSMTHGSKNVGEHALKVKNIDSEEIKTLVTLLSPDKEIVNPAETVANAVNPPAVKTQKEDKYDETWAPWSNSAIITNNSTDRRQTVEKVLENAVELSEDALEPRQET